MKGLKKIGLIALSLAFAGVATVGMASCTKKDGSKTTTTTASNGEQEEVEDYGVPIEETDNTFLNSIVLDTKKVRKVFYIGEEFSSEGLIVKKSLRVVAADGTYKGIAYQKTQDFTVDYEDVNMSVIGNYTVKVSYRYGANIITKDYSVAVKSSRFETTPGITYNAGLEVLFSDNTRIKEYLLNNTTTTDYPAKYDASVISGLQFKLHKKSVSADGKTVTDAETINLSASDVTISNPTNVNQVGTYVVRVSYKGAPINIDGVDYSNDVSGFVVIDVVNPIKSISMSANNTDSFEATVDGIDAEKAGWVVRVTPTVGKTYSDDFTYEKYTIDGLDIFKWGVSQSITVKLNSDTTVKTVTSITISESSTQNIKPYYNLTPALIGNNGDGKPTDVTIAGTSFIHGPLPKTIKITANQTPDDDSIDIIKGDYYTDGATYEAGRKTQKTDVFGSIGFDTRVMVKGTSQAFKLEMSSAGDIVVFFASTGDEEREIAIYSDVDGSIGEKINTEDVYSESKKQVISKYTFHVDKAGTYYIANPSGGLYIHGFIIATAK